MQVESAPPGITDSIQEGPGHQKTVMPLANTQNCSGDILLCLAYPSLHGWTFQVTAYTPILLLLLARLLPHLPNSILVFLLRSSLVCRLKRAS